MTRLMTASAARVMPGRSALLLCGLWSSCTHGLCTSTAAANQKLALHLAQLQASREARKNLPTAKLEVVRSEAELCERLGIAAMRPFQRQVLKHLGVLDGGGGTGDERRDVLSVQPTGAGKSVCFQAAGAALEGTTLVVSPLLSLMFDQVASLSASGIRTATLNSMQGIAERQAVMASLGRGEIDLLYTSPEQLDRNAKLIATLRGLRVPLLAVDEAHCISSWGHDFRPSYKRLRTVREALQIPRLLALTASAPPIVRDDIVSELGMGDGTLRLVASCRRDNIRLMRARKSLDDLKRVLSPEAPGAVGGPALVYAQTRKEVDLIADALAQHRGSDEHVMKYHAGMSAGARKQAQDRFLLSSDDETVMVATNAFGMGIDKGDIRTVVHYGPAGTIEALYQELGRGGRDGKPTRHALLTSDKAGADLQIHRFFLETEHPRPEDVGRVWKAILRLGVEVEETNANRPIGGTAFEMPDEPPDLSLACAVGTLQDATALGPYGGQKVASTSRCVNILRGWGFLQRLASTTSVALYDDDAGTLQAAPVSADEPLAFPGGLRPKTQQARAWRALAQSLGLEAALAAHGGGHEAGARLLHRRVETDTLESWAVEAGMDATQFANALRALEKKKLVTVERSPTLQLRVPGEERGEELPEPDDERIIELEERREHSVSKLRAVEEYMRVPIRADEDESDALWRQIMAYFGE